MHVRWWELAPETVLAAGLLYFLVDETHAATSAFKSGRAIALMAGVTVTWIVARLLLARFVRWPVVRLVPFAVAAVVILAVVVVPAYDANTVVETLSDHPAALDRPSNSSAPGSGEAAPLPPVRIRTAVFRGIDHRAEGTVNIYRRTDGSYVIGLESFEIQPGPDYDVYVVPGTNRQDRGHGTRLDDLRGNAGTQFYEVAAGLELDSGPWTVLIWCQTFGVPVANATPT
jgi:hypothetical protein